MELSRAHGRRRLDAVRLGALCWVLAAPVFLAANLLVPLGWDQPHFSWATHNISDLGNVTCGVWDTTRPREVCSPWHATMNAALVVTGLMLLAGTVLAARPAGRSRTPRVARVLVALGSIGFVLAGAAPADVDENLHVVGAALILVVGNLGLLLFGAGPAAGRSRGARLGSLVLGCVALTGTVLFVAQVGPVIGVGGMERVAAFALPIWASGCGALIMVHDRRGRTVPEPPARTLMG